jgi:hypothetical protein
MERNKRWSKEEEQALLDCIKECDNIATGLEKASKTINRSFAACKVRYEKTIPKNKKIKTVGNNRKRTKWDKEKDRYLLDYVGKHPNNIFLAFEHIANKYNTTTHAVQQRYYTIRKNYSTVFTTIGKKTHSSNAKNIPYDSSEKPEKHSIWSKLKKLLKI